jgi:hypothetical protein
MSIIPLHIQRRFEQRWAARFGSLAIPAVPKNPRLKGSPGKTRRARQKPTRVRYSGVSFVYQASGIFASGLTPIIATWLLAAGGNRPWLFCGYVVFVSVISLISIYAVPESVNRDMVQDEQPSGETARPAPAMT